MKPVVVCLTLVTVAGGLGGVARGDGKFFAPENVPANVPYQRAFLLFHEGCETLLLQSKYEIPPSAAVDSLGWVVPVPAIPEISSMDADAAWFCFRLANRRTQPQAIHISHVFLLPALVLFLGGVGLLLVCLVQYPFIYRLPDERTIWGKQIRWVVVAIIVGFLLLVVSLPHLA
jgi:hypothetical protein